MKTTLHIALTLLCFWTLNVIPVRAADVLVSAGSTWRYLDNGTDQGTAWRGTGFDDSGWASGPAQLGYGDGDEATVVSFGPNSGNKYVTTYFRRVVNVTDPSGYVSLTLNVLRDDGVVVYLNGVEVFRDNMPGGTISYNTWASTAVGGTSETTFLTGGVDPELLVAGDNVLAVEIHQANGTSSDISFDLSLEASDTIEPIRGPYLQQGTSSSAMIRWRTPNTTDGWVRYGTDPGNLQFTASDSTQAKDHIVTLTGLAADTRYYYELGDSSGWFGANAGYFFRTPPPVGTAVPTRIWALGDSGTKDANAAAVRDAYVNFAGTRHTDVWLMLGDNAYDSGTDSEFQAAVFDMYPEFLKNTFLWPTRGNHESDLSGSGSTYYAIFSLPINGEAGGLASGTEAYYSFDYANIHFVCLDSQGSSRSSTGPMAVWLQNDLAATAQDWIIAFWHHPPYSKGSHNSDTEGQLIDMRQNFLPILEAAGVDLVLAGHSHSYERSYLLDGHYGSSGSLDPSMVLDQGDGRETGDGAYTKATFGLAPNEGAVYIVAGSSGKISGGSLNHPAMFVSLNNLGSVVVDVDGNRMDVRFLRENGATPDHFTIIKGGVSVPAAPANLAATPGDGQVGLGWDSSATATSYNVKRSTTAGGPYSVIANVASTTYADTGLNNGTTYFYVVSANNEIGESADSNEASATPTAPPSPPAAPTGLVAEAQSGTQIELTWTDNSSNEDGFEIYQSLDGVNFSLIGMFGPDATSALVTGLNPATTYHYFVRAFNSGGFADSNVASDTTSASSTLFFDGFESGGFTAGGWQVGSPASVSDTAAAVGSYGALLKKSAFIAKVLSPGGASVVNLTYWRRTDRLGSGEALVVEVSSDGANWGTLESVPGTTAWQMSAFEVAVSGPQLHLRFRLNAGAGSDLGMIDDVQVSTGEPNAPPEALGDAYAVDEDNVLTVAAPGVLGNDTDPEGEPLTAVLAGGPSSGSLQLNSDGSFTYTPDPNFSGSDSFTYTASDGLAQSSPATVNITVNPINDAPVAVADAYGMAPDTTLTVSAPGVLGNDTDADSDELTASLSSGPAQGTLNSFNADGSFSYTPNPGFTGQDSFVYVASDGNGGSSSATVTITVETSTGPTTMHVQTITVTTISMGKGVKRGQAEVIIVNDNGAPVAGASVTGTFSEDIQETANGSTDAAGRVLLSTSPSSGRMHLTFCVGAVSGGGLTYDSTANVETCDTNH